LYRTHAGTVIIDIIEQTLEDEAVQSRTNIDSALTPPAVKFECNVIDGNAQDDLMENEPFENSDRESKEESSNQLMEAKKRPGRQLKSVRKSSRRRETGSSLANGGVAKHTGTTAAEISCDKCRLVVTVSIGIRHFYPGDVYPGSDFYPSRIPDPTFFHPGSRIQIFHPGSTSKNLSILTPKIVFFKLTEI
jgi:hypothetical protein